MNYTIHQLRIFLKVTEKLSITKASQDLHITQPAASVQLKNFQKQFPHPLIEVIGKKIYVTDFGKEIALLAKKILMDLQELEDKSQEYQKNPSEILRISAMPTAKYILPYFISDFIEQHKNLNLKVEIMNKTEGIESLENGFTDISFMSIIPDTSKMHHLKLMQNKLFLIGSVNSNLAEQTYDKSILEDINLIYGESDSVTLQKMERFITTNNLKITKKTNITGDEALKQLVISGVGYSIMPKISVLPELKAQRLKIIQVEGLPIVSSWNAVWSKDREPSKITKLFLEYLESEKNNIVRDKISCPTSLIEQFDTSVN